MTEVSKDNGEKGRALHFDAPKTSNGVRDIPVPNICVEYLCQEKLLQQQRLGYFNLWKGEDTPVCANSKSGFMRPSNPSKFAKVFL